MIFCVFIRDAKQRGPFLLRSKNKRERLTRNNRAEHELEGCPVLHMGNTSRYLTRPIPEITRQTLLKNRRLLPITKIREK